MISRLKMPQSSPTNSKTTVGSMTPKGRSIRTLRRVLRTIRNSQWIHPNGAFCCNSDYWNSISDITSRIEQNA